MFIICRTWTTWKRILAIALTDHALHQLPCQGKLVMLRNSVIWCSISENKYFIGKAHCRRNVCRTQQQCEAQKGCRSTNICWDNGSSLRTFRESLGSRLYAKLSRWMSRNLTMLPFPTIVYNVADWSLCLPYDELGRHFQSKKPLPVAPWERHSRS